MLEQRASEDSPIHFSEMQQVRFVILKVDWRLFDLRLERVSDNPAYDSHLMSWLLWLKARSLMLPT